MFKVISKDGEVIHTIDANEVEELDSGVLHFHTERSSVAMLQLAPGMMVVKNGCEPATPMPKWVLNGEEYEPTVGYQPGLDAMVSIHPHKIDGEQWSLRKVKKP